MRLPLPPPQVLDGYKGHVENMGERFMHSWEAQEEHRHAMEREAMALQRQQLAQQARALELQHEANMASIAADRKAAEDTVLAQREATKQDAELQQDRQNKNFTLRTEAQWSFRGALLIAFLVIAGGFYFKNTIAIVSGVALLAVVVVLPRRIGMTVPGLGSVTAEADRTEPPALGSGEGRGGGGGTGGQGGAGGSPPS